MGVSKTVNITPLKQKLLRALTRSSKTLQETSAKQWTICPAERGLVPPAIFLENDLDKITAVMEDTTLEQEMARIRGGEIEHAATIAYSIADCELLDGSLYKSSARLPLTKQPQQLVGATVNEFIEEAALASSYYGSFYFGHWLTDDLTLYLAAEPLAKPVIPARTPYGHEQGYLDLLNIQAHAVTRARFGNLVIFDDFGQNAFKRQRYQELRTRLLNIAPATTGARVFIRRGQQGAARALTNATEIEHILQSQGFHILDPENSTVAEIVKTLSGARLVVGLEGSHMLHCIYTMAENGGICILQPPYRFNNVLKNYSDCLGMTYGFVTGRACDGGFAIDTSELLQVLDKIERALPAHF